MKNKIAFLLLLICAAFLAGKSVAKLNGQYKEDKKSSEVLSDVSLNSSWGLSFVKDGETPNGNESKEELEKNNAYFVGNESEKIIYLTFDAGYENGYTKQILEVLKKHNVTATFFVVGTYVRDNADIVKQMKEYGQLVGSHSYSHPDMSNMSKEQFNKEIKELEDIYKENIGMDIDKVYRPPMGKYSDETLKYANELGYKTIFWSLAYVDWYEDNQPSHKEAIDKLTKRIHNGAIVLLHSTSKTNAEILDELLTKWEEMGYTFGVLTDI